MKQINALHNYELVMREWKFLVLSWISVLGKMSVFINMVYPVDNVLTYSEYITSRGSYRRNEETPGKPHYVITKRSRPVRLRDLRRLGSSAPSRKYDTNKEA